MAPALSEVDVAILGNGPAALALSAVLGGAVPAVVRSDCRDPVVRAAAERLRGRPLDEVDLASCAAGVRRRCANPTAALVDALRYPEGDGMGASLLAFGLKRRALSHVLVGRGQPGGSWHDMSSSTVTLSPASWMDLLGEYTLAAHLQSGAASDAALRLVKEAGAGGAAALVESRVPRWLTAEYYAAYAARLAEHPEGGAQLQGAVRELAEDGAAWRLRVQGADGGERTLRAKAVVLAGGMYDMPDKLGVPGEDLPWVGHRVPRPSTPARGSGDVLLVVGAGLSATDAIVAELGRAQGLRVAHVFRGAAPATKVGRMFSAVHMDAYAAESRLCGLMAGAADPRYAAYADSRLVEIRGDGVCVLERADGARAEVEGVAQALEY